LIVLKNLGHEIGGDWDELDQADQLEQLEQQLQDGSIDLPKQAYEFAKD